MFCSSLADEHSATKLNAEQVQRIGRQAIALGLEEISLSGGEPLLHEDVNAILQHLSAMGLRIRLYTSGIVESADGRPTPFSGWSSLAGFVNIAIFNVQSCDEAVHDELTGRKGSWRLTMLSLEEAIRNRMPTEIHVVPNGLNLRSLSRSVEDFDRRGVGRVSFLRLVMQGHARQFASRLAIQANDERLLRETLATIRDRTDLRISRRFGAPLSHLGMSGAVCNAGCSKLIVRYDGVVFPCEAYKDMRRAEFELGHVASATFASMLDRGKRVFIDRMAVNPHLRGAGEHCPAQRIWCSEVQHAAQT